MGMAELVLRFRAELIQPGGQRFSFGSRCPSRGNDRHQAIGTVKLTTTGLADPQDDGLESCRAPGMLGGRKPDSA